MAGSCPADSQLQLRVGGESGARNKPRLRRIELVRTALKFRSTRRRARISRRMVALSRVLLDRGSSLSRGSLSWLSKGIKINSSNSGVASTRSIAGSVGASISIGKILLLLENKYLVCLKFSGGKSMMRQSIL